MLRRYVRSDQIADDSELVEILDDVHDIDAGRRFDLEATLQRAVHEIDGA